MATDNTSTAPPALLVTPVTPRGSQPGLCAPAFVVLRFALVPIPLAAAVWAAQHDFGLLHRLPLHPVLAGAFSIILFDYVYYWWHIATHRSSLLWRFHNVHHTNLDMDVSTATRFHVGELLLSVVWRTVLVLLAGIAPLTLIIFEIRHRRIGVRGHTALRSMASD